jgi:rhodanese-related sulfurtransferase
VFVDVRSAGSYAASHIPGALSIPLGELDARLDELDPAARIITYCT